jgi:hypothetical protein
MKDRLTRMLAGAALVVSLLTFITGGLGANAAGSQITTVVSKQDKCPATGPCGVIGTNVINSADIVDSTIVSPDLHGNSVTTSDIAPGAVTSTDIQNGAIQEADAAAFFFNQINNDEIAWDQVQDIAHRFVGEWSGPVPTSQSRLIGSAPAGEILAVDEKNYTSMENALDGVKAAGAGAWDSCLAGATGIPCLTVPATGTYDLDLAVKWAGAVDGTLQTQVRVYPAGGGDPTLHNLTGSPNTFISSTSIPANQSGERIQTGDFTLNLNAGDKIVVGVTQLGDLNPVSATVRIRIELL